MRKFKWFLQCSQRRNYSRIKISLLLPWLWWYSSRGHFIGHLYCNLPHILLLHLICSYYLPYKSKICCCISCGIVHLMTNLDYPVLFFSSVNHSLPGKALFLMYGGKYQWAKCFSSPNFSFTIHLHCLSKKLVCGRLHFNYCKKNNLSPNADWDALQRQKNMHEIMLHVLKTKEKSLAKDVLASNSSNIITPYKNESPILLVCYTLI